MIELPIDSRLPEVCATLRGHGAMVLVAPPGAGKTTRVPPAVLGVMAKENPHVIMLQPRRVAARAAAQRIAEERGWRLGEEVGYHIRFEKRYGPGTRIRVLTEAILTRMLLSDPGLEGIGCVILDEFHERNLHTDLALAFLREVQQTIRPELKIVVMSATLEAGPVAAFLGGEGGCPVIESAGRGFPIEVLYRPARDRALEMQVAAAVEEALEHGRGEGDVLVFLPGVGEIERARRALRLGEGVAVLPLHGSLTSEEQQLALRADGRGRRKVILATNIAETSLTIDGIRTVIDSGLVRVASYDADRGMDRLDLEAISQASATQRAGRAGRQGPGRVIRLWAEAQQKHLAEFNVPEIRRVDLAGTVLAVHAWGAKEVRGFGWFEVPEEGMLAGAEELLTLLGALEGGRLTELGRQMLAVPAHPRIARLLLAAVGTPLLQEALTLAAVLADETRAAGTGDPLAQVHRPGPQVARVREQLGAIVRGMKRETRNAKLETAPDLLLLAYPDRIARRRGSDPYAAVMVGGVGLRLAAEALTPAIVAAPLFLALDAHHDPRNKRAEATVRTATPVEMETLERLFAGAFRSEAGLHYDAAKEKVVAVTRRYFRDLVLEEDPHGKVDAARAGEVLAAALGERAGGAEELFRGDERAGKLLARVALVRHYMPEVAWPAFDEGQLRELLGQACAGKRSLAEVREGGAGAGSGGGLAEALRSALVYPLDRMLEQQAPEAIEVPSGSHIKLEYTLPTGVGTPPSAPQPPVLAVRLQEMFGLMDTPRVAGGRVAVLLHLLSPGYKPMQITSDLRSFWAGAYFEVRKDLRVRYPKHKWPEDPLTAAPEAKGRRRG